MTIEGIEPDTLMSLANSVIGMCCFLFYEQCVHVNRITWDFTANGLKENNEDEEWLDLLLVNYLCSY